MMIFHHGKKVRTQWDRYPMFMLHMATIKHCQSLDSSHFYSVREDGEGPITSV